MARLRPTLRRMGAITIRKEADLDLGQPEGRIVGGDHDIAARGEAAAAGERVAVHAGDHRRAHARHLLEDAGKPLKDSRAANALQVRPESPVSRSREHDDPRRRIRVEQLQGLLELADHGGVERVADLRPVEGDGAHAARDLDEERLVGHAFSSRPSTMSRNCFRMRAVAPQMMSSTETS